MIALSLQPALLVVRRCARGQHPRQLPCAVFRARLAPQAAAAYPQPAGLNPVRSAVLQLAVAAAPAPPPRPPAAAQLAPGGEFGQAIIIGGMQIPTFLVWILIATLGLFWALFFGVLIAMFPTLREVPGRTPLPAVPLRTPLPWRFPLS